MWNQFQQGMKGLFASPNLPQGGVLGEAIQPQQDARMALAASLLTGSNSGEGFNAILGKALMAGQAARQQAQQFGVVAREQAGRDQERQAQIAQMQQPQAPHLPQSVQEFEYAQQNPEFKAWIASNGTGNETADIQNWKFFQTLQPDQQKQWTSLQRQPTVPQVVMVNGVPNLVDRITGGMTPLTSVQQEASAQGQIAQGRAVGEARGQAQGGIEKKAIGADNVTGIINIAEPLIDVATGSTVGAATDAVAGFFGKSLQGAQATAQLRALEASLILAQPRMEGPQSNADAQRYEQAAGQIGDPKVPRETKKAALKVIRSLQERYKAAGGATPTTSSGGWKIEAAD